MSDEINKGGRPTLFQDWMYDDLITRSKQGQTLHYICSQWDIGMATLTEWKHKDPKFAAAHARAREAFIGCVQQRCMEGMSDRHFNHNAASLLLGFYGHNLQKQKIKTSGYKDALEAKDYGKAAAIVGGLADEGEYSADEVNKMMDSVAKAAQAENVSEMRHDIDKLLKDAAQIGQD